MKTKCTEQAVATKNNEKYFCEGDGVKWEKKYIGRS